MHWQNNTKSFLLSVRVLFTSLMQSLNGAEFLNTSSLSLSSACLAAWSASIPAVIMIPLTSVHHLNLTLTISFKFNLTIGVLYFTRVIICFNPIFCPKFRWLILYIVKQINYFLTFQYYIIILILIHEYFVVFLLRIYIFLLMLLFHFQN